MTLPDIEQNIRTVHRSNEEVMSLVGQLLGILDIVLPPENIKGNETSSTNRLGRLIDDIQLAGAQNERQIMMLNQVIAALDGPQPENVVGGYVGGERQAYADYPESKVKL